MHIPVISTLRRRAPQKLPIPLSMAGCNNSTLAAPGLHKPCDGILKENPEKVLAAQELLL